jgi:hypothetical protein
MPTSQAIARYIEKYRNKATVVRQIHSNIAESKRKWDIRHTLATIILGATFTFTGFMGTDRIFDTIFAKGTADEQSANFSDQTQVPHLTNATATVAPSSSTNNKGLAPVNRSEVLAEPEQKNHVDISKEPGTASLQRISASKNFFNLMFSAAALSLFILSTLNLIYRWKEDHTLHFQGVVKLTAFVNWLDELKLVGIQDGDLCTLKGIRSRYQAIVESLPPNDEKEYLKAKSSLANKNAATAALLNGNEADLELVKVLIKESPLLIAVLKTLNATDSSLWLGGGAIRNHVWDKLTGRVTLQDDFDVVYFSLQNLDPVMDQAIEQNISPKLPSILKISVKNQARMHLLNGEPPTKSLEDAIAQWPETATAIAARLNATNELEVIAPYGYTDLLNMVVRPTPYHVSHPTSYQARKAAKRWKELWPELTVQP